MEKSNEMRTGRHCVFNMHVHLVFVTKYRKKIFTDEILLYLRDALEKTCSYFEAKLKEFNGNNDHVHLLVHYHPKISISKLVNSLKGASSRLLKTRFPQLTKYYWKNALWSPSYFAASCGGALLEIIKQYIQNQHGEN